MRNLALLLVLAAGAAFAQNPATAKFPSTVAGDSDLGVACNSAHSTLSAPIDNQPTSLTLLVASSASFCSPSYVTVDSETMKVCSTSTGTLTLCSGGRQVHGSIAAHSAGAQVTGYVDQNYLNQVFAEIKAIETGLGANFVNLGWVNHLGTFLTATCCSIALGPSSFTPVSLLHLRNNGASTAVTVENPNAGGQSYVRMLNNNSDFAQVGIYGTTVPAYGSLAPGDMHVYSTTNISLMADLPAGIIKWATGGNTERMRLDATGNLGIGTVPNAALHVKGTPSSFGILEVESTANNAGVVFWDADANANGRHWQIATNYQLHGNLDFMRGTSNTGAPTTPALSLDLNGNAIHYGHLYFGVDNSYDIVGSGVNRPRNVRIAGTYTGNGSGLTNVAADTVGGYAANKVPNSYTHAASFAWQDNYVALPTSTLQWGVFSYSAAQVTISRVVCSADTTDAVIQLRNSNGNDFLTSNLACGQNAWSATPATSFVGSNNIIATNQYVGVWIVSGTAKRINVDMQYSTAY